MKKDKIKKIKIDKKRFKIRFINEKDDTMAEIVNPPCNFIIPRIGEHFEIQRDGRTNVVTSVYHDWAENEIIIWYDFHACYENKTIEEKDMSRFHGKIPTEIIK